MKKAFLVNFFMSLLFAFAVFGFFSCADAGSSGGGGGGGFSAAKTTSVSITLPKTSGRAVYGSEDADTYTIKLISSSGNITDKITDFKGGVATFNDVLVGTYKLRVEAFSVNKSLVGVGETEFFKVVAGKNTPVSVKMKGETYFTLTFDANGGTGSIDTVKVTSGEKYILPKCLMTPPNDTLKFGGWSETEDADAATYSDEQEITVSKNHVLYAHWIDKDAVQYTVKHLFQNIMDDEYTENEEKQQILEGVPKSQTEAVPLDDVTGFEVLDFDQQTVSEDGSTVVEIKYNRILYSIIFMDGEASISDFKISDVKYGTKLTDVIALPDDSEILGKFFDGWYSDEDLSVSFNLESDEFAEAVLEDDFCIYGRYYPYVSTLTESPTSGTYAIKTYAELKQVSDWSNDDTVNETTPMRFENVTFIMTEDIDASSNGNWVPICKKPYKGNAPNDNINDANKIYWGFKGTFDGRGHKLTVKKQNYKWYDFSGIINSNYGIIENLQIESVYTDISFSNNYQSPENPTANDDLSYGFFADTNYGTIRNCIASGSIRAGTNLEVAGFVRTNYASGVIENCINKANIEVYYRMNWGMMTSLASGFVSYNHGTIKNCVNYGTLWASGVMSGSTYLNGAVAAIAGICESDSSTIKNCYWLEDTVKYFYGSQNYFPNTVCVKATVGSYTVDKIKGTVSGCGMFNESGTISAGTTDNCDSAQTLQYGTSLLNALNGYVGANPDSGLCHWKTESGKVTLDF